MNSYVESVRIRRSATPFRAVVGATILAGLVAPVTAAFAAPGQRAGDVVVVDAPDSNRKLTEGGSATHFSLKLPTGSSCPGDSTNGNYRVQSFLVPADYDPGQLRYQLEGPDVPGAYALYDRYTSPFTQQQTAQAESLRGPGLIINLPVFSYAVLPMGGVPDGPYRVGIACTLTNETIRFWDTVIDVAHASDDKPAGFRWRTRAIQARKVQRSSTAGPVLIVAAMAVAVATFAIVWRRPRGPAARSAAR